MSGLDIVGTRVMTTEVGSLGDPHAPVTLRGHIAVDLGGPPGMEVVLVSVPPCLAHPGGRLVARLLDDECFLLN